MPFSFISYGFESNNAWNYTFFRFHCIFLRKDLAVLLFVLIFAAEMSRCVVIKLV